MPYCPNPNCSFRKRHGEAAGYIAGTRSCSDCGTILSQDAAVEPAVENKSSRPSFSFTDFHKRLIWTLVLMAFTTIISHVPVPGLNFEVAGKIMPDELLREMRMSVLSLGLTPYFFSYMLVEIFALFMQPLKRWRDDAGPGGRERLIKTAYWLTLIVAILMASAIATSLGNIGGPFIESGMSARVLMIITLVAGTFLSIGIADMISRKGIGHGISILVLTSIATGIPHDLSKLAKASVGYSGSIITFVGLILLATTGLLVLIIAIERSEKNIEVRFQNGISAYLPVKLTTAGLAPSSWIMSFLAIPGLIIAMSSQEQQTSGTAQMILQHLSPGTWGWNIGLVVGILPLYAAFTRFFYNRNTIICYLKEQTRGAMRDEEMLSFEKSLTLGATLGSVYLIFVVFFSKMIWRFFDIPMIVEGTVFIVAALILFDLMNEVRARWSSGAWVKIAEYQEPWKAGLVESFLRQNNIPVFTRGYHYRTANYFFTPYIEMSTYIPAEKKEVAETIIKEYLHGQSKV
jgi:preprotein translocase subunit SecY